MKLSYLEIVQDILSDLNDDEVNSISDTIESLQVAQIVKSVYFEIIDSRTWPHLKTLFELEASSDNTKPTHMKIPENIRELDWLEYNKTVDGRSYYTTIGYVSPDEFIRMTATYNTDSADVSVVEDYSGVKLAVKNNAYPEFWTSFDDENIVFNAYDKTESTTLLASSTRASGYKDPIWQMKDEFVPDLPSEAFSLLLAEAKSTAFVRMKEVADQKAEQQSARQRQQMQRKAWKAAGGIRLPNYSRRSRK